MNPMVDRQPDDERKCIILMTCARMLMYPDDRQFTAELTTMQDDLKRFGVAAPGPLMSALDALLSRNRHDLAEEYVSTFDLKDLTTLHVTAHELGDSRERGSELLALAQMYRVLGLTHEEDQLADYLPQLLEMLVVAIEESADAELVDELEARIATACRKIGDGLTTGVYKTIFDVLVRTLRPAVWPGVAATPPSGDEAKEDMPYPLNY